MYDYFINYTNVLDNIKLYFCTLIKCKCISISDNIYNINK